MTLRPLITVLLVSMAFVPACGGSKNGSGNDGGIESARLRGTVRASDTGEAIEGARVTLTDPAGDYIDEYRTGADGRYGFDPSAGDYRVGASARTREYRDEAVTLADSDTIVDLELGPETELGRWSVIGSTESEYFAGTPSATLMPNGRVFYCHNTEDGVVVDPATGDRSFPAMSPSSQGCHMQTVLSDGRIIFVGGQDPDDPGSFTNGIPT